MRKPFVGITNEFDATFAAAEHPAAKARKYARLAAANKRAAKAIAAANVALIKAQVLEDELIDRELIALGLRELRATGLCDVELVDAFVVRASRA